MPLRGISDFVSEKEPLELATVPIRPDIQEYRLEEANPALRELKERKIRTASMV
jgi:D-arabinose 1-dehydrogenase-like Zn-dependent alcohol dehydrogenase